jgi:methyl-accepting chemotaxis protein
MRRLVYIHPKIQFGFTGFMAGLFAIELILASFFIVWTERLLPSLPGDYGIYLRFGSLFVFLLVATLVNLFFGARISHRIAGPLVQIQRTLDRAQRGDYGARVQIRSNDFLQEVGSGLNVLLQRLEIQQNSPLNNLSAKPIKAISKRPRKARTTSRN